MPCGTLSMSSAVYGVGVILALAVFAPQILTLMAGPEFAAGAPALVFIAVAIALAGMTHILRFALVACEKPRFVLIGDSVACACAFAAYFALIPQFSFVGAAIGTVVAEVASLVCMLVGLRRAGRPLPSIINPLKAVASGAATAAAMIFLDAPRVALAGDAGDRWSPLPGLPRADACDSARARPQCVASTPSCVSRKRLIVA